MSLPDAIAEALANATPPPKNESTTCDWVIYPLLLACGYARREIESRIGDNNGQFPDYAILPDSPHGWYLEAKAWSVPLEDRHAAQAMNYAHQNGKRWVVLTNGQEWRLYDDTIQGLAADRLSATVRLDGGDSFEAFLTALGKQSVCGGALERYAARARLEQFLATQIADENSETVCAVHAVIKRQPGLGAVSRADVAGLLRPGAAVQRNTPPDTLELSPNQAPPEIEPAGEKPYRRFWAELLIRAEAAGVHQHRGRKPRQGTWIDSRLVHGRNVAIGYMAQVRECRVYIWIDEADRDWNKRAFDALFARRVQIEASFGAPLTWDRKDTKRAAEVRYRIPSGGITSPASEWPALHDTMIDAMDRLVRAIQPHLDLLR